MNRQVGLGFHCFILYPIVPPSLTVSVDVKHDERRKVGVRARELCEQAVGLGSHSLSHCSPVHFNKPHGFWGRKAPRKKKKKTTRFTIGSETSCLQKRHRMFFF